jgi:alkylation response protein AidB-like acyl-CoA dehydrogenase
VSAQPERPSPVERALALEALVHRHADASERQRHLHHEVAAAFARSGLYRIAAPADCGGEGVAPAEQIETIETISRFDASAGWNLMIGVVSFGLIAPAMARCRDLIADPEVVLCSSTAAVGHAERVTDGWRVSGRWQFVSGCHNSSVFGATVRLHEHGEPLPDTINHYAMVPLGEFTILDTWHVAGLCGSGSHDVELNDVLVPDERIVKPLGVWSGTTPLARFPLGPRLAYNKVAVSLGIARAAIDAFVALAEGKVPRFTSRTLRERPHAQRAVAEAEIRLRGARAAVFELLEEMWTLVRNDANVPSRLRALFQIACSDAVAGCAQAVDQVVEAAGTTANQQGHPLERLARDVRVVRQHVTVANHHIEDAGRILLGLPPTGMMLAGPNARD